MSFIFFVYDHDEFDEPYDGIVYSASVSLGFATLENILYLLANGVETAIARALLPVSSHALFSVIMGFYFGKAKFAVKSAAIIYGRRFCCRFSFMASMTGCCSPKSVGAIIWDHLCSPYGGRRCAK
ncbi:Protease PrsW [Geobacillus sp. BCO2]|nr:Protease PrsW [Geobacillus sp. BCO2]